MNGLPSRPHLTRGGVGAAPALSQSTCAAISTATANSAITNSGTTGRSKLARLLEASRAPITPKIPRKLWNAMVPYTSLEAKKNALVRSPITLKNTTVPTLLKGGLWAKW